MNETLKTLQERRSVRRYTNQQVEESALNAILEAGTWAPSGMGTQASVLVAVQDPETIALMSRLNAQIMEPIPSTVPPLWSLSWQMEKIPTGSKTAPW